MNVVYACHILTYLVDTYHISVEQKVFKLTSGIFKSVCVCT